MSDAPLRVLLIAGDPVRKRGLAAMLESAGHVLATDSPDVVLYDLPTGTATPPETEAPIVLLTDGAPPESVAGALPRAVDAGQLDLALRAVAVGLMVRAPGMAVADRGFRVAEETPPLTPREAEILALVGQGMTNKEVARQLGISVHTVKFHLETLFEKLDATSRAEAVAKGLRGGVLEI